MLLTPPQAVLLAPGTWASPKIYLKSVGTPDAMVARTQLHALGDCILSL